MSIEAANDVLIAQGFAYVGKDATGWLKYRGQILGHSVALSLDRLGLRVPKVRLVEVPDRLKPYAPHLSSDGTLCYIDQSTISLDVFDLAGQLRSCLAQAEKVLSNILNGEMSEDFGDEFSAYWQGNICLFDARFDSASDLRAVIFQPESNSFRVAITDDLGRTIRTLEQYNGRGCKKHPVWLRSLQTEVVPRPLGASWPPETVGDMLSWQTILDPPTAKKLRKRIMTGFRAGAACIALMIHSPSGPYGAFISFANGLDLPSRKRKRGRRRLLSHLKISRLTCFRMHDRYVAERSNPAHRSLAGVRILLIGCGTIGGFLAELLVKSGAGIDGGKLSLVDNEILLPQNIGRHRLGFNNLFKNKAVGLSKELGLAHPTASVEAMSVNALEVGLSGFDIIVDATGEEPLTHLLAKRLTGPKQVPSVSVWLEGPGIAIRALLRDTANAACPRCLVQSGLYPSVQQKIEELFAGAGCEASYVPFAVSASMQAACLASEVIIGWANSLCTPRLRTRILDAKHAKATEDCDPPRFAGCPACRI